MARRHLAQLAAFAISATVAQQAFAVDSIKIAVSHKTTWDAVFAEVAINKGFFKEQNLEVSAINATGGSDTVQALTTGSVQFTSPTSVHAAITAYLKGAPLRIVANQLTGAPDIYWYAKTDGPIKKWSDLSGKKVAYSRPGSVTHMLIQGFMKEQNLKFDLVSGGGLPAVRTMLETGQVDASWGATPFGLDGVRAGKLRILFTGDDVKSAKPVVNRVTCTSADILKNKPDLVRRFLAAYQKAVDFAYGPKGDEAIEIFAKNNNMELAAAKEAVKLSGDHAAHMLSPVHKFEEAVNQAVEFGMIKQKLTDAQMKELVDLRHVPKS